MVKKLKQYNFYDCVKDGLLRKIPSSKEKAEGSIKTAQKWLEEAQKNLKGEAFNSCVMSSYLSMFHSTRAILFLDHYRELRHDDQYSISFFAVKEEAESALKKSKEFVGRINRLLEGLKLKSKIKIAPSILSADKIKLQKEVNEIEPYSDLIHIDIMDGKFVPPTTFKPEEIKKIKTKLEKDVHLMVQYPIKDNFIKNFADAGASIITIHEECKDNIKEAFELIRRKGVKVGISINPSTSLDKIKPYLDDVDMVLIMSVNPGYPGQKFIPDVLPKIKELRKLKPNLDIEIDGGINKETIKKAAEAGANVFVAGSAIFKEEDRKKAIGELRKAAG